MAKVDTEFNVQEWAEDYLTYLIREWEVVPQIAEEWDTWEDHEQLNFVLEWPISEDRWLELQRWAKQGLLTPAQCARYDSLTALISRYRPVIERLLADDPSPINPPESD